MHRNTWKRGERQVAALFGTKRNPLSGGNSGITRSDSRHEKLFIECKHGKKHAVWTLHDAAKKLAAKEGKTPVIALKRTNSSGTIFCIHQDNLVEFFKHYVKTAPTIKRKKKKGKA